MSWAYRRYGNRLVDLLARVRERYMGQDRPLADLAPEGAGLPAHTLADRAAQVLTLQMARITSLNDEELRACWRWLKAAALFLLLNCPPEDHTPRGLLRLAGLSHETLELLERENLPRQDARALLRVPCCVREHLEEAVWALADLTLETLEPLAGLLS